MKPRKFADLYPAFITDDRHWNLVEEAVVESQIAFLLMLDGVVDAFNQNIAPVSGDSSRGLSLHF